MNETKSAIVKYYNELNDLDFSTWKPNELNLFFSIVAKLSVIEKRNKMYKKKEPLIATISKPEIRQLMNLSDTVTNEELIKLGNSVIDKIDRAAWINNTGHRKETIYIFDRHVIDEDNDREFIVFEPSKHYDRFFRLYSEFTLFELRMFVQMKSVYSKTLFRLLKQWRFDGYRYFELNRFKEMLGIPPGYRNKDISSRIIKQIETDFKNVNAFDDFQVEPDRKGRLLLGYGFRWKPEERQEPKLEPGDIKIKIKSKEEANTYIAPRLYESDDTPATMEDLLELYILLCDAEPDEKEAFSDALRDEYIFTGEKPSNERAAEILENVRKQLHEQEPGS